MPSSVRSFAARFALPIAIAATFATGFAALPASADVTHVIGRGHTIEQIAHRYHVTVKAIMDANHLKDTKHLKPGDTLIIPGVTPPDKKKHDPKDPKKDDGKKPAPPGAPGKVDPPKGDRKGETPNAVAPGPRAHGPSFEDKPKEPDVVHFVRFGEELTIRIKDKRGKIPPPAMKSFQKALRSGNAMHAIDARLVALIGLVSNHFGGRKLEIVSGFRPYTPTQYTQHSNHNLGKAIDFRVQGVPNDVLRDFCKGLRNVGVGYYPNSYFVHLDVRDAPAFWIDYSKAGESPKYDKPSPQADEGVGDVPEEPKPAEPPAPAGSSSATPPTPSSSAAPPAPPPSAKP
jgi:uncharacterized protein YcbK (DUF882 family)/LysM repeat protein